MKRIYFDYNATTPVRPEVLEAMLPYFGEHFGNPSSVHTFGQEARRALEKAREQIAGLTGADTPSEIVFTSGGTEANNMALIGSCFARKSQGNHIVSTMIEHSSVLGPLKHLTEEHGFRVTYAPPTTEGMVTLDAIKGAVTPNTILVSVMHANNELGTIQPIEEIGAFCRERKIAFHVDAIQSFGKIAANVEKFQADLVSVSSHKIYGPKGIGALYVRKGARMTAILYGGKHEKNRRAGTENVPGIIGFGKACELAGLELDQESTRLKSLRDNMEKGLIERLPDTKINGAGVNRLPNTSNISFRGVESGGLLIALDQAGFALHNNSYPSIAVSSGSACAAGSSEPSHVLKAIGLPQEYLMGSIRFSLGKFNTEEEIELALEIVPKAVSQLRETSPIWQEKVSKTS